MHDPLMPYQLSKVCMLCCITKQHLHAVLPHFRLTGPVLLHYLLRYLTDKDAGLDPPAYQGW
jgi:hypothetical protein